MPDDQQTGEPAWSLGLVMIARNEARCIQRCLESVRGVVNHLLVLDTGSTDATVALAREAGAQVASFIWCDDFSAARNAALALSPCDWRLVLDADEWLEQGHEALRQLRHQPPSWVGQLEVSSLDETSSGPVRSSSWISRLLPRGMVYEGRIHEQPVWASPGVAPARQRMAVRVAHDGYLPAFQASKYERNHALLQALVQQHPDQAYAWYQWGKNHEVHGHPLPAVEALQKALGLASPAEPWRHDLILRLMQALQASGQYEQAFGLAQAEWAHWGHSPDFHFNLGNLFLNWALAEPHRFEALMPLIQESWMRCLSIGENSALEGAVQGRGSYLAAGNLAAFHESLGQTQEAAHWRSQARLMRVQAQEGPPCNP
jgi:glycosyltransferase involved in cell wall biosynthesis